MNRPVTKGGSSGVPGPPGQAVKLPEEERCLVLGQIIAPFLTGPTPGKTSPDLHQFQEHPPAKVGWTGHVHFNPPHGDAALGPTYFRISGWFAFIPAAHF